MRARLLPALLLAATLPAAAEQAPVNLHLDLGLGSRLDRVVTASSLALKVDTTLLSALGPLAPQVELFGASPWTVDQGQPGGGNAFGAGVGLRLRLFNDEQGFLFYPHQKYRGSLWGNAFLDAHATYSLGGVGPGFDVSLGAELSLLDGLSVGPLVKFAMTGPWTWVQGGLVFTVGAPPTVPPDADFDGDGFPNKSDPCVDEAGPKENLGCPDTDKDKDGVVDRLDKCMAVAEDQDGFEDEDGCPDFDNDGDAVEDSKDKCPTEKGPAENRGCPDLDGDGDGLLDRLDACPKEKGVAENKGCPDSDSDGDGVVDRLDACRDVKGDKDNKGCAWPDTDGDSVTDNVDNCPGEKGTTDNQGCPAKDKQLVVLTREKLTIKDRVYFDASKAVVQARSHALLEQVAKVLVAHPEIGQLQIEGHTDNSGVAAANRKLSQERAEAVKALLVKKGVAAERLGAVGFGPDRPLESNDTPTGREANRRVEFTIVAP